MFASIDLDQLATVVGGSETTITGSGGGISVSHTRTAYEVCADTVTSRPGWKPEDIKTTCGMPQ